MKECGSEAAVVLGNVRNGTGKTQGLTQSPPRPHDYNGTRPLDSVYATVASNKGRKSWIASPRGVPGFGGMLACVLALHLA